MEFSKKCVEKKELQRIIDNDEDLTLTFVSSTGESDTIKLKTSIIKKMARRMPPY